ncbi:MAG TPA: hypothetical protein VJR06_01365 [Nitrososphaerales archaeon]|nr:hypothetical protein [Nitrososphaerales archaeon]
MVTFTVTGEVRYSQAVLEADIVQFNSKSRLVLAPTSNDKGPTSSNTLVIIAKQIVIADHATITWDLDGLPGDPPELVYDPDTPAPPTVSVAPNGFDGFSPPGTGSFPQAANGTDGGPGMTGAKGISGLDAPELEIFVGTIKQNYSDAITVNFKGQDGGRGGSGGNGGKGGDGQKGAPSQASDSWYDGDNCDQDEGKGGNGGKGGDAGYPGRGGAGGNGGVVKVFALKQTLPLAQGWKYIVGGGKGAPPGNPGNNGKGGAAGAQGDQNDPCPDHPEYAGSPGPDGQSMGDIDMNWMSDYSGPDGQDGDVGQYEIDTLPS